MNHDIPQLLAFAVETARSAGEVIMRHDALVPHGDLVLKGMRDPVTEADIASERHIVGRIRERYPDDAIYAEEETRDDARDGLTWYVDPIDGTVNFSQSHPFFAVSIALFDGQTPLVGVVHAPRLQETFAAGRGLGTTLNGTPVNVSSKKALIEAVLATGFSYQRHELVDNNVDHFNDFILNVRGLRRCGSAALDLAYTAAGRLDGYWEPHLRPFDVAAGALLVLEAGGVVTDMSGGDDWLHGGKIAAAPKTMHALILSQLADPGGDP
ncbi:MAG: inositol monophosphatase family protein [Planctomycetota bacterium]|nr:inositol monophosphatase family protein [Planctomycetota bacterium]